MKRILFISINVFVIIVSNVMCYALPLSSDTRKLNNQFDDGRYGSYDYVYFSPVKGEDDDGKYPLTVWLHGRGLSTFPRAQLQWYEFCNWSSDEYQARFENAGSCFLLAPRAQNRENTWDLERTGTLKAIIDDFISKNAAHIDTSRIYIAGYSTGGSMVWNMLTAYPDFFAAGVPLAALTQPVAAGLEKLKNTSVWIFVSDNDPYIVPESGYAIPNFNYLAGITNRPEDVRLTRFSEAFFADGTKQMNGDTVSADAEHFIWECATYDMFMDDGVTPYKCATTVDANGNTLTFEPGRALITWLSNQTNTQTGEQKKIGFFEKVRLFFERIFQFFRSLFPFAD